MEHKESLNFVCDLVQVQTHPVRWQPMPTGISNDRNSALKRRHERAGYCAPWLGRAPALFHPRSVAIGGYRLLFGPLRMEPPPARAMRPRENPRGETLGKIILAAGENGSALKYPRRLKAQIKPARSQVPSGVPPSPNSSSQRSPHVKYIIYYWQESSQNPGN